MLWETWSGTCGNKLTLCGKFLNENELKAYNIFVGISKLIDYINNNMNFF